ncbi:MAG: HAMP domain-containing protein, partial [Bacillota bacterium]
MLNWNRYSLRKQLLLLFIFVQFVLLVGLMFFFYNNYHQSYLDQLESSLRHQAILISDHSISEINDKSAKEVDNWSKEMSIEIKKRITIIDREGIVIADSDYKPEEMDNHLGRPEIQELLSGAGVGSSIRQSDTLKRNMFYLAIPIQEDNRIVGFIRLSKSLEEINRTVTDNIKNNLVFFLFMILLTLFFVWKITKNIINPLSEVTHIAGNLAKGNFQERITIKGYENEIGSLVKV